MHIALFEDKEMRLREDDKRWLDNEIAEKISTGLKEHLNPHGWRKLQQWLPAAAVATIFLGLLTVALTGWNFVFSRVDKEARFEQQTTDTLQDLSKTVDEIRLKQSSTNAADPRSITQAKSILAAAKSKNVELNKEVISEAGSSFIKASEKVPAAWDTALDLVSYRTTLNANLASVTSAVQIAATPTTPFETRYAVPRLAQYPLPTATVGGDVPAASAADIRPLDKPSWNQGQSIGREVILLDGGGVQLDGYLFKNVVIRNATVAYSGGPTQLENVIFVNCTFILPNVQTSRNFADAVLSNSATTFPRG